MKKKREETECHHENQPGITGVERVELLSRGKERKELRIPLLFKIPVVLHGVRGKKYSTYHSPEERGEEETNPSGGGERGNTITFGAICTSLPYPAKKKGKKE